MTHLNHRPLHDDDQRTHDRRPRQPRTLVCPALLPELACRLDGRFTAELVEVGVRHNFSAHELVLEVGVDDTGSLRRLRAFADGPGAHFLRTAREVADELHGNQTIARIDSTHD